jgi:uncharacterized protein (TIGR02145 family)
MGTTNMSQKKSSVKVISEQPKRKAKTPQPPQQKTVINAKKTPAKTKSRGAETVTDADGNIYTTVKIGNQVWTVENLKTTKYNNGRPIPLASENSEWNDRSSPAFCWFANDIRNKKKYGALYNWHAVNTGKLAPEGWHVPTDSEWTELENYLIANGYNSDGTKEGNKIAKSLIAKMALKIANDSSIVGNDLSTNNHSGFSALLGGSRYIDGTFFYLDKYGYWWSASEGGMSYAEDGTSYAWSRYLVYNNIDLIRSSLNECHGSAVRLLKD